MAAPCFSTSTMAVAVKASGTDTDTRTAVSTHSHSHDLRRRGKKRAADADAEPKAEAEAEADADAEVDQSEARKRMHTVKPMQEYISGGDPSFLSVSRAVYRRSWKTWTPSEREAVIALYRNRIGVDLTRDTCDEISLSMGRHLHNEVERMTLADPLFAAALDPFYAFVEHWGGTPPVLIAPANWLTSLNRADYILRRLYGEPLPAGAAHANGAANHAGGGAAAVPASRIRFFAKSNQRLFFPSAIDRNHAMVSLATSHPGISFLRITTDAAIAVEDF